MQRCKARSSQNDGRMRREHEQSDGLVLLTKCVILKLYLVNKCIHTSDVDLSVFYNGLYVLWSQMFGDPCYTRCFVMLLMKPGELCGKQVLKVTQQLFLFGVVFITHFSDNYRSFTSRHSLILQEQSTIQRCAGDYPGGQRNQVIADMVPKRMSPQSYLETGKIVVGCNIPI